MKKIHRVFALLMAAIMALSLITTAFAEPTIDPGKKASLSIYKYDITKAGNDGAWDAESYVSTGLHDDAVVNKLAKYAIQGVEFTYLRVADIAMNNEVVDGKHQVGVLYGFDSSDRSNAVLSAIGLTGADAHKTEDDVNYFTSDMLNNKLAAALAANATTVKNALEAAVKNGGVAMSETDATGHTSASDMEQGLYLVVETRVPENVTSTCNPFLVSLPMTTIDGAAWNYDVTVYPKNQTGNPNLEKTVREDKNSTGKNTGSLTDIKDGYKHTATASVGDVVDYQIISTLPTITSKASSLSEYTYVDTMSKGIKYNKQDVVIEFFRDSACTDKITTWAEDSGKFTVSYDDTANTMTIRMTDTGLSEINEAATVYTDSVKRGYSDCTMRISYAATLTAAAKMGDTDNPNEVVLTWKRTNTTYYDTLKDCCHVYTYGIDVLKQFSDGKGNIQNVKFNLHNDTDNCYIIADLKDGTYYAKGITTKKADAKVPKEYRTHITEMQEAFYLLDSATVYVNQKAEEGSLDPVQVKAVFFALCFGDNAPTRAAADRFVDCFYKTETRTRTVTVTQADGTEELVEETYEVAVPLPMEEVYEKLTTWRGRVVTDAERSNAVDIYAMVMGSMGGDTFNGTYEPGGSVPIELNASMLTDLTTKNAADLVTYVTNAWNSGWGYVWGTYGQTLTPELLQYKLTQYPDGVGKYAAFIRTNWLGKHTADCVGLIKGYGWLSTDTMAIDYGTHGMPDIGANEMYYSATRKGTIETIPDTPGLAVWKSGHIGVYIGNGEVIEAMGTKYGVVKTQLEGRGWTHWLEVPGIEYE